MMTALCHPNRKHYAKNQCNACYMMEWNKKSYTNISRHRHWVNSSTIKKRYGITFEEREELKRKQGFKCAICLKETKLYVDHKHGTKTVRGLICPRCNTLCGYLETDTGEIQRAKDYLSAYEANNRL